MFANRTPPRRGFRPYRNHESDEHQREVAEVLVRIRNLTISVLVDGMDQKHREDAWESAEPPLRRESARSGRAQGPWLLGDAVDEVLAEPVTE